MQILYNGVSKSQNTNSQLFAVLISRKFVISLNSLEILQNICRPTGERFNTGMQAQIIAGGVQSSLCLPEFLKPYTVLRDLDASNICLTKNSTPKHQILAWKERMRIENA